MYHDSDFPEPIYPSPATAVLVALLRERNYAAEIIRSIVAYVRRTGTLEGLEEKGLLEPEDRADADEAFEQGQPVAHQVDNAWKDGWGEREESRWTVADELRAAALVRELIG